MIVKSYCNLQLFEDGTKIILVVYINDIILTRYSTVEMEILKTSLCTEFEVKDLGQV